MDIQEFAPFAHALKSGCIVSEVKMVSEPSSTKAPISSQDILSTGKIPETQTPIPEHVKSPEQDNFNYCQTDCPIAPDSDRFDRYLDCNRRG